MGIDSGCGAAWLARLLGVQEVPSSNLGGPTKSLKDLQTPTLRTRGLESSWSPKVDAGRPPPVHKEKSCSLS